MMSGPDRSCVLSTIMLLFFLSQESEISVLVSAEKTK